MSKEYIWKGFTLKDIQDIIQLVWGPNEYPEELKKHCEVSVMEKEENIYDDYSGEYLQLKIPYSEEALPLCIYFKVHENGYHYLENGNDVHIRHNNPMEVFEIIKRCINEDS